MKKVKSRRMSTLLLTMVLFLASFATNTIAKADVYTGARSVVGTTTIPPHRAEARFQPSESATLWSWNSGFGVQNGCTVHGGAEASVQANGGVWCRSLYKGFWSDWAYIPYQLFGSGRTFYSSSIDARTQCTLDHAPDTIINVRQGTSTLLNGVVVDVRAGRNSLFPNLLDKRYGLSSLWQTSGAGQVAYAVPHPNVYAMVTKNNWDYIAPITSVGSQVTINVGTGSHTVSVKKRGVPATNREVIALHEAFFQQSALSYLNFQAHATPMVTDSAGMVEAWPQPGMPIRFVAFDTDGNGYAVGPVMPPVYGATKIIIMIENEPTLSTPAHNASIIETTPAMFSWGVATGASGYALYLWDRNSSWADIHDAGTSRSVGAYFYPGQYGWRVYSYDASGEIMTVSSDRFFTITSAGPAPANFEGVSVDQFDTLLDTDTFFTDVDGVADESATGVIEFVESLNAAKSVTSNDTQMAGRLVNLRQQISKRASESVTIPVIRLKKNAQVELPTLQKFNDEPGLHESNYEEWLDDLYWW